MFWSGLAFAFSVGALPSGLIAAQARGVDLRRFGSGSVGATNVARTLGWRLGIAVLLLDAAKAAAVVAAAAHVASLTAAAAALVAAVLGNVASPFAGFRGGKGVATAAGGAAALCPTAALTGVLAYAIVQRASGLSSAGSLAGLCVALGVCWATAPGPAAWALTAVGLVIVARHRENLARLRRGAEHRL